MQYFLVLIIFIFLHLLLIEKEILQLQRDLPILADRPGGVGRNAILCRYCPIARLPDAVSWLSGDLRVGTEPILLCSMAVAFRRVRN
jgi:hypothetical protein